MSPWHEIEIESSSGEHNEVTGVIEIPCHSKRKLITKKSEDYNPIMQDTTTSKKSGK
jgi:inorganic pyrophosphatase